MKLCIFFKDPLTLNYYIYADSTNKPAIMLYRAYMNRVDKQNVLNEASQVFSTPFLSIFPNFAIFFTENSNRP